MQGRSQKNEIIKHLVGKGKKFQTLGKKKIVKIQFTRKFYQKEKGFFCKNRLNDIKT